MWSTLTLLLTLWFGADRPDLPAKPADDDTCSGISKPLCAIVDDPEPVG